MKKISIIEEYLDELFPNPRCELNYKNDYELLMAIVLSAQSTDKRVNSVTPILFDRYRTLDDISNANNKELEDIIRPIGSFRKKAYYIKNIAYILNKDYAGMVPRSREELIKLPGVGRKTANVFLSEYYNEPAIGVDTHVERVSKRFGLVKKEASVIEVEEKLMRCFKSEVWGKRHLQMVLFGRYYCKAIRPECGDCKVRDICLEKNKNI